MFYNKINKIFKKNNNDVFIVGEISANHNGKIKNIYKIINQNKKIGLDAIKVQIYNPNNITINSNKPDFLLKKNNPWNKYKNLYNLYNKAQTPKNWYPKILSKCKKNNLILFSSVFDNDTIDFLEKYNCPIYKIASPEITDIPLLKKVARTKKPVIISSGLSKYSDLKLAISTLKKNGCKKIILLKCTSSYPAPISELNLKTMNNYKKKFNIEIGFSDHSKGNLAAVVAAANGAKIIEKHILLNRKEKTVDSFFSSDIHQFTKLVKNIRSVEKILGKVNYAITKSSKKNISGKKSIYVFKDIKKNEKFSKSNIKCVRPHFGLHPRYFNSVIEKRSKKDLYKGDRLKLEYVKK